MLNCFAYSDFEGEFMKFIHKDKVMVYDTDYQGVAHYASYYRFVTNAVDAWRSKYLHGYPYVNFVVVESKAVYKKSLRPGDNISVVLMPELISDRAIKQNFEIYRGKTLTTEGYITYVYIDKARWKAARMPDYLLKFLKQNKSSK